jgi:spore maturation protein CgeB
MVMNVGVFHNTAHVGSAWACAEGLSACLRRLGYSVFDFGHPKISTIPLSVLEKMDAIVLGAPEWFYDHLANQYGEAWFELRAIKAAWYAESAYRDDRNFNFGAAHRFADINFYPAKQDADEFLGHWLPFGADEQIFKPMPVPKLFDVAFIGSMYPKRRKFINSIDFSIAIMPQIGGQNALDSFSRLAKAYNSTHIFLNMPAYSRLLVTKVTEILLCKTMLITPKLDHPSATLNMNQFRDGCDLLYYDANKPNELKDLLDHYSNNEADRERIAEQGFSHALEKHTLISRVSTIMSKVNEIFARRATS